MHTPGPWAVHKNKGEAVPYAIRDKGTFLIGEIYGSTIGDPDEVLANARLIAAAPETAAERDHLKVINAMLLEALERLANAALDCQMRGYSERNATVLRKYEDEARAAIRAAKGESAQSRIRV